MSVSSTQRVSLVTLEQIVVNVYIHDFHLIIPVHAFGMEALPVYSPCSIGKYNFLVYSYKHHSKHIGPGRVFALVDIYSKTRVQYLLGAPNS